MRNNKMAFVLATAMGFGGMQVATAADMPVKAYPMTPPPVAYNWTGFYVGVDAGYHWNKVGIFNPATPASGTAEASPRSFTAGGHAGYLYQFNNPVVVGVEGDVSWLNGNDNGPFPGFPAQGIIATTRWDASVRGILGYAMDRTLFYATGGWSWMNGSMCGVAPYPTPLTCFPATSGPSTVDGWTVGGGVAHAFTNNLIARVEYLYADYGSFSYTGTGWTGGTVNVTDRTSKVRVGLSWKFGPM